MIKKPVDILTISETWLTDTNHSEGYYDIPGYIFKYRNRPKGITWAPDDAGGVGIYIADHLQFKHRTDLHKDNID